MKPYAILGLFAALLLASCATVKTEPTGIQLVQQPPIQPEKPIEVTPVGTAMLEVSNEGELNTVIIVNIEGKEVFASKELISSKNQGGYFGREVQTATIEVPAKPFTLEAVGKIVCPPEMVCAAVVPEGSAVIDPAKGKYLYVTFWGNKFTIEQSKEQKVRID